MKTFKQIQQTDFTMTIAVLLITAVISFFIGTMVSDLLTLDRYNEVSKTKITKSDVYYIATGHRLKIINQMPKISYSICYGIGFLTPNIMIQIYRIESKKNEEPEILIYNCCQSCAKKKKEEGYQITYDLYYSERYPSERKYDVCDECEESFYIDGRTIPKGGFLKSEYDSFC